MATLVSFFVPGLPVAQPRQRTRVVAAAGRTFSQNYTPAKHPVNEFKAAIRLACAAAHQGEPLAGPLAMTARFVFPRPKSMTRKSGNLGLWKASKPDWDNVGKALADALTGLLWADDAQLAIVTIHKRIAGDGEQAGASVEVRGLAQSGKESITLEDLG